MVGIYAIINPLNEIYIGRAANIKERIKKYKILNCKKQPKIYESLISHGFDKHEVITLIECEFKELQKWENFFFKFYKNSGESLLNVMPIDY